MTNTPCQTCGAANDKPLCRRCGDKLADLLKRLPDGLSDLLTTATKQARTGDVPAATAPIEDEQAAAEERRIPARLRSKQGRITLPATALPVSLGAAELYRQAVRGILSWACAAGITARTVGATCRALAADIDTVRQLDDAGRIHAAARDLTAWIATTIDRRDPDIYAGRCDSPDVHLDPATDEISPVVGTCGADLYARLGDAKVKCGACGMSYDLAARKQWLVEQIPNVIAPTAAIANALTSLLSPVTPSMIRQMAHRGEIVQRGTTGQPAIAGQRKTPLYRVGDVLEVLAVRAERKARKLSGARP